ncbi:MAG: hypothetical protein ACI37Z_09415, partial [Candidatus Gastranaerophilaceae bacterium]
YEVLGIFLSGSQNYGLDYQGSDIDTKCIVLPSFNQLWFNQNISRVLKRPHGQITVKDIRLMTECLCKQNLNFLEILFTKYKVINPKYADLFQPVLDMAEEITTINEFKAISCAAGMAKEKHSDFLSINLTAEKACKSLYHIARLEEYLEKYTQHKLFKECLVSDKREEIIGYKTRYLASDFSDTEIEDMRKIAFAKMKHIERMKEDYYASNICTVDSETKDILTYYMQQILKITLKEKLNGG